MNVPGGELGGIWMSGGLRLLSDVDFDDVVMPDAPHGWRTSRDVMENFLLAGALEFQARQRLFPSDPFAPGSREALPPAFRYDTLGSLLRFGPGDRERIGRLPLLGTVWEFVDIALEQTSPLRLEGVPGFYMALQQLAGVNLGKHGLTLFVAAFYREFVGDPEPPHLSPIESAFVGGAEELPGYANGGFGAAYGAGTLAPNGAMYLDSIWTSVWTILSMRGPAHYVSELGHRHDSLMDVLERGAQIAATGAWSCWPGWPSASSAAR